MEKFTYQALTASVFKKVIAEILGYVEGQKNAYNKLHAKKFKGGNEFSVGR